MNASVRIAWSKIRSTGTHRHRKNESQDGKSNGWSINEATSGQHKVCEGTFAWVSWGKSFMRMLVISAKSHWNQHLKKLNTMRRLSVNWNYLRFWKSWNAQRFDVLTHETTAGKSNFEGIATEDWHIHIWMSPEHIMMWERLLHAFRLGLKDLLNCWSRILDSRHCWWQTIFGRNYLGGISCKESLP